MLENMQNHNKQRSEDHNWKAVEAIYEGYYSASYSFHSLKYAANRRYPINSGLMLANIATSGRFFKDAHDMGPSTNKSLLC